MRTGLKPLSTAGLGWFRVALVVAALGPGAASAQEVEPPDDEPGALRAAPGPALRRIGREEFRTLAFEPARAAPAPPPAAEAPEGRERGEDVDLRIAQDPEGRITIRLHGPAASPRRAVTPASLKDGAPAGPKSTATASVTVPRGATIVIGGASRNPGILGRWLGSLLGAKGRATGGPELIVSLRPDDQAPAPPQTGLPALPSGSDAPRRASAAPKAAPPRARRVAWDGRDAEVLRASAERVEDDAPETEPESDDPGYARHLVRRGETFRTIARRYYGSEAHDQALWAANQDAVASPDRLTAGMAIAIPPIEDLDPAYLDSPSPRRGWTPAKGG